jgi:hypothetical protein
MKSFATLKKELDVLEEKRCVLDDKRSKITMQMRGVCEHLNINHTDWRHDGG